MIGRTCLAALSLALASCRPSPPRLGDAVVDGLEHVVQLPGLGGQACAEMVLGRAGWALGQEDLFRLTRPAGDPSSACNALALHRLLTDLGVRSRVVEAPLGAAAQREAAFRALHADLAAQRPSIVCMRHRERELEVERFRLVFGYDAATASVRTHDPARPDGADQRVPVAAFLERWLARRVVVEQPPAPPASGRAPGAELLRLLASQRQRLPRELTLVAEPPFVLISDDPTPRLQRLARATVRWATARLRAGLFARDLAPTELWLLRDHASYRRHSQRWFGVAAPPGFGFYTSGRRAAVLDLSLGRGTVVHELVHAFLQTELPGVPAWLDEGLSSLYEASGDRDDHLHGYPNWRLSGVQQQLRAGKLPSLAALLALGAEQLQRTPSGDGQAQLLCYYLQERGLLRTFYRALLAAHREDPTGAATLLRVTRSPSLDALERQWRSFALSLHDGGGFDPDLRAVPAAGGTRR